MEGFKIRKCLRILILVCVLAMMLYQLGVNDQYLSWRKTHLDGSSWGNGYLRYRSVLFYIVIAILSLLRNRSRLNERKTAYGNTPQLRFDREFWCWKLIILIFAGVNWICVHFYSMPDYLSDTSYRWTSFAGTRTLLTYGYWVLLVYGIDSLRKHWPGLRNVWTENASPIKKILMSVKEFMFSGIASAPTMAGKVFYSAAFVYTIYTLAIDLIEEYCLIAVFQSGAFLPTLILRVNTFPVDNFWPVSIMILIYYAFFETDG